MIQALGNDLIPVIAITLGFLFLVTWVVAATIDSLYKTKCNSRLKEKLVDRGASALEIHQIVNAGSATEDGEGYVTPVPPVKSNSLTMTG